jgi:multidrug resistance efflux pump
MNDKQAYEKKLQARYDEWSAEIDKLKAKADSAEADLQLKYQQKIGELTAMQEAAGDKLDELKNSSSDAWQDLKSGADAAWRSVDNAMRSAGSRF